MRNLSIRIETRTRYGKNVIRYAGTRDWVIKTLVARITGNCNGVDTCELVTAARRYCEEHGVSELVLLAETNVYRLLQLLRDHRGLCRDPPHRRPRYPGGEEQICHLRWWHEPEPHGDLSWP